MIRKIIITVLILAAVGTATLWVVSRSERVAFEPIDSDRDWLCVDFHRGRVTAYYLTYNFDGQHAYLQHSLRPGAMIQHSMLRGNLNPKNLSRLRGRFQFVGNAPGRLSQVRYAAFPLWVPLLVLAAYPCASLTFSSLRRRYRHRRGRCSNCRYDLTGNISGVCPECGTEIETT